MLQRESRPSNIWKLFMTLDTGNPTQNRTSRLIDHQPNKATVTRAKTNRIAFQTHAF